MDEGDNKVSESLMTFEGFLTAFKERDWTDRAACKGLGTSLFFPTRAEGGTSVARKVKMINRVCGSCPVQKECGEYGDYELHGFWGGKPPRERQRARTASRNASS